MTPTNLDAVFWQYPCYKNLGNWLNISLTDLCPTCFVSAQKLWANRKNVMAKRNIIIYFFVVFTEHSEAFLIKYELLQLHVLLHNHLSLLFTYYYLVCWWWTLFGECGSWRRLCWGNWCRIIIFLLLHLNVVFVYCFCGLEIPCNTNLKKKALKQ